MRVGCDIGGTFTDLIARDPATGELRLGKALNSGVGPTQGVLDALAAADLAREQVTTLAHGTTTVTNLLIERTGAEVGLVTTRGFRDVLEIQYSFRSRTFDARYTKTPPLVPRHRRLEIGGRISRSGAEVEPLDRDEVLAALAALRADGVACLAVALYNAYANPAHELAVAEWWRELAGGAPVTCSTDVDRRIGEYERCSTAVLNATAVPRMRSYVAELGDAVPQPTLYMHSAGGALTAQDAAEHPIQLAFSGPAAGVLAAREVARALGLDAAITLDMGGTSCDVALLRDGELRERESFDVAWGVPARVRSLDISTIGAGGGSIAWRDGGGALRVGPASAGALPGPACYGRGGERPCVTDANLVLGILPPEGLLDGKLPLDADAASAVLAGLGEEFAVDAAAAAKAVHATVNANMAGAVREITVRHGIDPRECALIAFGGAGPQHATGVAAELGIGVVVVPAHCSLLSAAGLLNADVKVSAARTLLVDVSELASDETDAIFRELADEAARRLETVRGDELIVERWAGLRYRHQWHELALLLHGDGEDLVARFEAEHERRFGTRLGDPVEAVDIWVTVIAGQPGAPAESGSEEPSEPLPSGRRMLTLVGDVVDVYDRRGMPPTPVAGPCLVEEATTVTVVPAGTTVRVAHGHLVIEAAG